MDRRRTLVPLLVLGALTGCATSSKSELARSADPVRLRKQFAATLLANHVWGAALKPLGELAAMKKTDADVYTMLGIAYREQGMYDEAERNFREALRLDARRAEAYSGLAMVRDLRGEPGDQAVADAKKAVELRPDVAAYANNLGFALYQRGRYREAIAAFKKGLERDPTARRIRNNLGFAYGKLGELNYAKREFHRAGPPAEAENNLGFLYEQAGDAANACERYRAAAEAAPKLEAAQVNLVRACGKVASTGTQPNQRSAP